MTTVIIAEQVKLQTTSGWHYGVSRRITKKKVERSRRLV